MTDGHFRMLALDHALAYGPMAGISAPKEMNTLLEAQTVNEATTVILNAGMLERVDVPSHLRIVAQLFGAPRPGMRHRRLYAPSFAIKGGADALAVQTSADPQVLDSTISQISTTIQDAHDLGFPVLVMIASPHWDSVDEFMRTIRGMVEVGADLVKGAMIRTCGWLSAR